MDGAVGDPAGEVDAGVALPRLGACRSRVEKRHGHAEVPLPDRRGAVAAGLEQGSQGGPVRLEQGRAVAAEHAARQPRAPRVAPGEERVAGRGAHRGRRVSVDEAHALAARRSMWGVGMPDFGCMAPTSPQPRSSARKRTTFGVVAARSCASAARVAAPTASNRVGSRRSLMFVSVFRRGAGFADAGSGNRRPSARPSAPSGPRSLHRFARAGHPGAGVLLRRSARLGPGAPSPVVRGRRGPAEPPPSGGRRVRYHRATLALARRGLSRRRVGETSDPGGAS